MARPRISACVIVKNEECNIRECLESLRWTDEIVVVDSGSTDKTLDIAREFTDKVFFKEWEGHIQQKNFALECASCEWAISLDADERVTPELREEILRELSVEPLAYDGFEFKRKVFYLGRWIRHSGWYPDYKLRVVRRAVARWQGVNPHDHLTVKGPTKRLRGEILHYSYRSLSDHLRTIDSFTTIAAQEKLKSGEGLTLLKMLFHPPGKFVRTYFLKLGFLDGLPGLVIAVLGSYYVFLKYAKLIELRRSLGDGAVTASCSVGADRGT